MNFDAANTSRTRLAILGFLLVMVLFVFLGRLFYLQVVKHSQYQALADQGQHAKYEIPPERGEIYILDGEQQVPLVLNETRFTLFADTRYFDKEVDEVASELAKLTGDKASSYAKKLSDGGAYVVLKTRVEKKTANAIKELEIKGIGLKSVPTRSYPEGRLASHVAGFVNDDGQGQYGIEQYYDKQIGGVPGLIDSAKDVRGIPIVTDDTIQIEPIDGKDVVLSIDRDFQGKVEESLKTHTKKLRAQGASAIILDVQSGQIKAMANYPDFAPQTYYKTKNADSFINDSITSIYEPGSIMKIFSMSAGLNEGAVTPDQTFNDPGCTRVDSYKICNAGDARAGTRTVSDIITNSLNTGSIFVLEELGGGEINNQGKSLLYEYLGQRFRFGKETQIELVGEEEGVLSKPEGSSDVRYANMAFGQGVSINMLQAATALSSILTDGVYRQPTIVAGWLDNTGNFDRHRSEVYSHNAVTPKTANQIKKMMESVVERGSGVVAYKSGYKIGGKTSTAEIPNPAGGYYEDREIGSFLGYITSDDPRYVIMVRVDDPKIGRFAGSDAAAPLFAEIAHWLIEKEGIPPSK